MERKARKGRKEKSLHEFFARFASFAFVRRIVPWLYGCAAVTGGDEAAKIRGRRA